MLSRGSSDEEILLPAARRGKFEGGGNISAETWRTGRIWRLRDLGRRNRGDCT